jgi:hypothetical protein
MTPDRLLRWLLSFPYPGAVADMQGGDLVITLEGEALRFDGAWRARDGQRILCTLPDVPSADDIHAEIRRGLAIARGITGASWHRVEQDDADPDGNLVYRLLSAHPYHVASDLRLSLDGVCRFNLDGVTWRFRDDGWHVLAETIAHHLPAAEHVTAELLHTEIRRVLAIVNADPSTTREQIKADCVGSELPGDERLQDRLDGRKREAMRAEVKRLTDGHAVVSQRLIGSQKEVAEVSAERDEATARAAKVEDRLRRDDELREQIAVAVGIDRSASLALILDTVNRDAPDDPRAVTGLRALLDYTHAPIRFGERQLSDAERASFVIRRLDARASEVIAAEVFLDCAGVPAYALAPGDDPDAPSERLSLSERLRLHFAGRS